MAEQLITLAACAEDLGSDPSTPHVGSQLPVALVLEESDALLSTAPSMHLVVHMHM